MDLGSKGFTEPPGEAINPRGPDGATPGGESLSTPEISLLDSRRIWGFLLKALCLEPRPSSKLRFWPAIMLAAICLLTAYIGAVPTLIYGHDTFYFLENGWRTLYGLRPQLDYWSPWGPLMFLIVASGMKLANASPNAIGYGSSLFGLAIGLWTYRLGRHRFASVPRLAFSLFAVLLVVAPYPLGVWPLTSSHAMLYNRYGYALVALVIVECFQPPEERAGELAGGGSSGAAAALALFLKASFFFVALPLIAFSLFFRRPKATRLLGLALGFGAVALMGIAYLRFDVPAIVNALRMAAAARAQALSPQTPLWTIEGNFPPLFLALALALGASFLNSGARNRWTQMQLPFLAVVVYLADIGLLATNAQTRALPLLSVYSLLVINRLVIARNQSRPESRREQLPYHAALLILFSLIFLPPLCSDVAGLAAGTLRKAHPSQARSPVRFIEPRLSALILYDSWDASGFQKNANGSTYTTYVNDGTSLLRRYCSSADRVLTMDMQNPFPYALGWRPPLGGLASLTLNFTVSAQYRPSFDAFFGDSTVVMVPKRPAQVHELLDGFYAIYFPVLTQRFSLAAQSDWWWLYKRK